MNEMKSNTCTLWTPTRTKKRKRKRIPFDPSEMSNIRLIQKKNNKVNFFPKPSWIFLHYLALIAHFSWSLCIALDTTKLAEKIVDKVAFMPKLIRVRQKNISTLDRSTNKSCTQSRTHVYRLYDIHGRNLIW